MNFRNLMLSTCVVLLAAMSAAAQSTQGQPGTIAYIERQTPKNGMVKQYEDGRKAKAEWHKQQKDTTPLLVSEILTGDHSGDYLVGSFGQHWADLDHPTVPAAADFAEYQKAIVPYVEKMVAAYYEFLPKWSSPSTDMNAKYIEVITFHVRYARGDDFRSAIARTAEARQKTNSAVHPSWYRLANGGPSGTYVLTYDHADYASMADDPAVKPLRDTLREAFGEQEAFTVIERLQASIESTSSELIQTRPDLSYIPAK
jgi:hypothetical protein